MSLKGRTLFAVIGHGGKLIGLIVIVPLIIMLNSDDDYVRAQAKEAIVFDFFIALALIISAVLITLRIGIVLLPVILLLAFVTGIIAIINVLLGRDFTYPVIGNLTRKIM